MFHRRRIVGSSALKRSSEDQSTDERSKKRLKKLPQLSEREFPVRGVRNFLSYLISGVQKMDKVYGRIHMLSGEPYSNPNEVFDLPFRE